MLEEQLRLTAPETHGFNYIKLSVDVWLRECSEYYVVNPTFHALVVCFAQDLRLVFAGTNGEDMRANQTRRDPVSHETPSVNYTSADITLISSTPHKCIRNEHSDSVHNALTVTTSLTPLHVVVNTCDFLSHKKNKKKEKEKK